MDDSMGELGLIYYVAPVVFVGGSLASHGGQNPIEPIKLGAAILHGPNVWNFAEIYAALGRSHGAQEIADADTFAERVGDWLKDVEQRKTVAKAARETVAALGGGLERTLAALEPYLMQIRLERRARGAWAFLLVGRGRPCFLFTGAAGNGLRRGSGPASRGARPACRRARALRGQLDG